MIALAAPALIAATAALSGAGLEGERPVEDLVCLALNIYHEARGESAAGQAAVAHVTLNRVRHRAFPGTVCGVVSQCAGASCQFGWWRRASVQPREPQAWDRALDIAAGALAGAIDDPTHGAQYFVTGDRPTPGWASRLHATATIGGHRFLRR